MSRNYSPDDLTQQRDSSPSSQNRHPRQAGRDAPEDSSPHRTSENRTPTRLGAHTPRFQARSIEPRKLFELRSRVYRLRDSEIQTMVDIGKFRVLGASDLEELAYTANRSHLQADLANLRQQGLIMMRRVPQKHTVPRHLVALTKEGRRFLVAHERVPRNQVLYYGFSKLREADHDADLYRLYHRGLDDIALKGGKERRVILDSELKRIVYRDLTRAKRESNSPDFAAIAERHGLKLIRGTIPIPDLRVEYETSDHEQARVDLELATEHYRFKNLAKKASAGFSLFARPDELSKLRRVMDERGLVVEILSL